MTCSWLVHDLLISLIYDLLLAHDLLISLIYDLLLVHDLLISLIYDLLLAHDLFTTWSNIVQYLVYALFTICP